MTRRWIGPLAAVLCAAAASPAAAWFEQGHYMVAEIAWNGLNSQTRCAVGKLLPRNASYPTWIAGVAPAQQAQLAFVNAADWADAIKKAGSGYQDDGDDGSVAAAANNLGYADTLMHKYWHFIDTPISADGTPTQPAPANNAAERIATFTQALSDPSSTDDLKSYDLTWLLHLVGDIHQPLHASDRFSAAFPGGDVGGNQVKISGGAEKELHFFWDALPGDSADPTVAIAAADALPAADPTAAAIADPAAWASESLQMAQTLAYAPPVANGAGPYDVYDSDYAGNARAGAMTRVELAGARLANLLNTALAAYPCP